MTSPLPAEECVLVLQGGGALGAYQGGVFEALAATPHAPEWIAGVSIGAINAALIAGNPPERRTARLREFWDGVSAARPGLSSVWPPVAAPLWQLPWPSTPRQRSWANEAEAAQALAFGVPGFFQPRCPPAPFQPPGSIGAISYYDTAPLAATLTRLVDFELLNSGTVRLSVGAVDVQSGNFQYFDTRERRLDVRHIMASGALPPGFAPVEIDGRHYWDGGVVSNTPLQHVLDQPGTRPRLVFQVDLFAAQGQLPADLGEVTEREKDIRFSSRTRLNTRFELERQAVAEAARRLIAKLPPGWGDDPDLKALAAVRCDAAVTVVHLVYRSKHYESESKDYEFSRVSMLEHWQAGNADMAHTLRDQRWLQRERRERGVQVFDLTPGGPAAMAVPQAEVTPSRSAPQA